jgi:hypothetical protein
MRDVPRLYLNGFACTGDACTWLSRLEQAAARPAAPMPPYSYNTRRLDKMVALSVEAAFAALARSGILPAEAQRLGVVGLSHNGPSLYSEDFIRDLMSQADPALVNPMPFAESVLNIAAAHVSLALKTKQPVYTLHTDLEHFFDMLDTLFLLTQTKQFDRGVFCVCEEFSVLGRRIMSDCSDLPGTRFVDSALAVVFSTNPGHGGTLACLEPPQQTADPHEFIEQMHRLRIPGVTDYVWSAYSSDPPPSALTDQFAVQPSFLEPPVMDQEQAFMVTRMAEVLDCGLRTAQGRESVLIQSSRGVFGWVRVAQ